MLDEVTPRSDALGFYVHVPFCVRRCGYCAFATAPLDGREMVGAYLRALRREIDLLGDLGWAREVTLATIFLGGGTPSVLEPGELGSILEALGARFRVEATAEITVECNPESVGREKLEAYRQAGVNRVSLGVQSMDDGLLRALDRRHDAAGARRAYETARAAGVDNVSVDLMYGLPGLDQRGWQATVEAVLGWEPDHLSAYGLSVDAGSAWGSAGVSGLPAEDEVVRQYWRLAETAARRGYEHYEISNYARPGFRSRHNLNYWRRGEYLAAGPAACGFVDDLRYQNARATARYVDLLDHSGLPLDGGERLTPGQARAERLILGLRTADGVPATWLAERLAGDPALGRRLASWREAGLLVDGPGLTVRLTERGFLLSDALFADLL